MPGFRYPQIVKQRSGVLDGIDGEGSWEGLGAEAEVEVDMVVCV